MSEQEPDPEPQRLTPTRTDSDRVREHLANERTYLAWIRTGLAMMGFGFIAAKLRFELVIPASTGGAVRSSTLGALLALVGIGAVALATWHYYDVRRMIESGTYRPLGGWLVIFAAVLIGIGIAIILNVGSSVPAPP